MDKETFLATYPQYGYDHSLDEIYQHEFSQRLSPDAVYLDHAGTTLYTQSQLKAHFEQLQTLTLNNPHSDQEDSQTLTEIRECIQLILSMFDTSTRDYSLIFTLNATHACQLLSSLFPFSSHSEYAYMMDSHNSLIGIRQQAQLKGASVSIIDYPVQIYGQAIDVEDDDWSFRCACRSPATPSQTNALSYCLFATPAENNFNGLRPPLNRLLKPFLDARHNRSSSFPIPPVHRLPSETCHWFTLVDCAKYLSTAAFSLSTYPVDFVVLSFYKIFGYPTGIGALIVRNEALPYLHRQHYFGGGSVQYVSPDDPSRVDYKQGVDGFTHGTVPFTTIVALRHGLQLITCTLTYARISLHTQCLIEYCRNEMSKLVYANGRALCVFYDARNEWARQHGYSHGPILNFNLCNHHGQFLSCRLIQRIAGDHRITLRAGTFCAPGASQTYLGSSEWFERNEPCRRGLFCGTSTEGDDVIDCGRQPLGSVRVSLGWMSRYEDVQRWIEFLRDVILQGLGIASLLSSPPKCEPCSGEIDLILTHIYLYPVKSCGSLSVQAWPLTSLSLLYDREWMIVDQQGNPLTLKRLPSLSQIKPEIKIDEQLLILNAIDHSPFVIDIQNDSSLIRSSVTLNDGMTCHVYGGDIELWLTRVLGTYATLARRATHTSMTLANEGAFLLVYEESVREIRSQLLSDENVTHERFRPNLVVDNETDGRAPAAYSEDLWKRLTISHTNDIQWTSTGLCQRCSVVNIDPSTGKNRSRLFTRLQTQRRELQSSRANFGILLNLSKVSTNAILRVGDRLRVFS